MPRYATVALLAVVLAAVSAPAQETTTGSLVGTVRDTQGLPIPGVSVAVTSSQGTRTFTTGDDGTFFAVFLTPARYSVTATLRGFRPLTRNGVDVRLGQRREIKGLVLEAGLSEDVTIESTATVDMSSTTAGGVIQQEQIQHLPVGRSLTDTLYLVPGVSTSGIGASNPSVGGASGLENHYIVDGVNVTNVGFGAIGSFTPGVGPLGSGITSDFVKETQVKSAGFEAEYGQATGGVVNVVTRNGGNTFHGSLFGYTQPDVFESAHRTLASPRGVVNALGSSRHDFGLSASGPLVKDKLFAFAVVNPQYDSLTLQPPTNVDSSGVPVFRLAREASFADGVDRRRRVLSYAVKATWQATSDHRLDVSVFGDPSHGDAGPHRPQSLAFDTPPIGDVAPSFTELVRYGGHNQVVKYDGILSPRWLVEASVARATTELVEAPAVDTWRYNDLRVTPSVQSGGIGGYSAGDRGENWQYRLKSTHLFEAGGRHQVRYGVSYEDITYGLRDAITGPPIVLPDGTSTRTGGNVQILRDPTLGQIYRVAFSIYGTPDDTTQQFVAVFLQDTWQAGPRLVVRPGIRYERERMEGGTRNPLCHVDDPPFRNGDGEGAAVPCEAVYGNNWAPRLGAVYDLRGDGRSKVFAAVGRYFAQIPSDLAARAMAGSPIVTRADYYDAALTRPIPEGVLAGTPATREHFRTGNADPAHFDPESGATYQDEVLAGVEVEAARNLSLAARYVHRRMPRVLEDTGQVAMILFSCLNDPVEACASLPPYDLSSYNYFVTNPRHGYPATAVDIGSFEDVVHRYDALELTASRSFQDDWSLLASYRWSRLRGNFEGFYRSDNGQSDPAIGSLFDFPTNDPTYTSVGGPAYGYEGDIRYQGCSLGCGALPNDRTHQLKVYGSRSFGAVNVGFGWNSSSGRPLTALYASPDYGVADIPDDVRGSGMSVVEEDGTTRFRERTPAEHTLDLHVDYGRRAGPGRIVLTADAFNVFDRQEPTAYDHGIDTGFGFRNLDFGLPTNRARRTSYQSPRAVRIGARFEW